MSLRDDLKQIAETIHAARDELLELPPRQVPLGGGLHGGGGRQVAVGRLAAPVGDCSSRNRSGGQDMVALSSLWLPIVLSAAGAAAVRIHRERGEHRHDRGLRRGCTSLCPFSSSVIRICFAGCSNQCPLALNLGKF